jgi:two-component system sensor histidine kinase UhpB
VRALHEAARQHDSAPPAALKTSSLLWVCKHLYFPSRDERQLSAEIETVLYRVAQEALTNVAKHARAEHVEVVLQHGRDETLLTVMDDGVGFDVQPQHRERAKGAGLDGMPERAALVGGNLKVEAKPGGGTRVAVRVPAHGRPT